MRRSSETSTAKDVRRTRNLSSPAQPRKLSSLAHRLLRSVIDIVDQEHRRERRLEKEERRATVGDLEGGIKASAPLQRLTLPPCEDIDSGISSGSLTLDSEAPSYSSTFSFSMTPPTPQPDKIGTAPRFERRRVQSESSGIEQKVNRNNNRIDGSRLTVPGINGIPTRQLSYNDVFIYVTDPMGAVNSRERRTSSNGCWGSKNSNDRLDADDHYKPVKPTKLKLDVSQVCHRPGYDLPTPSSDHDEHDIQPLSHSSNERLMQIIRCFPFPSPRSSPRESPRLKRKNLQQQPIANGDIEVKEIQPVSNGHVSTCNGSNEKVPRKERRCTSIERPCSHEHECEPDFRHVMGKLVQVSVETMAITALPKESIDCWLKERLKNWFQLSGHEGSIVPASSNSLYKKQTGLCTEGLAYQAIHDDPVLSQYAPKFYQLIEKNCETFIEIEDLLSRFSNPSQTAIMDVKIGTRTFLESEVSNTKMRKDLYEKMVAIDPFEPTEEERKRGEITKLRYMQFREQESSTASLGFRIEAAKMAGGSTEKSFKKVRTAADVAGVMRMFMGEDRKRITEGLLKRLKGLRAAVEKSSFYREHEVVGSSLLLMFDKEKVGVWMIDFAKAVRVPCGRTLTHRAKWVPGNGEDGYLEGIDNLIQILEDLPLKDASVPTTIAEMNNSR